MSKKLWHHTPESDLNQRETTVTEVIETIDWCEPETKTELASEVDLSEQYLSEILQSLKRDGIVKKSYTVDEASLYENIETISKLTGDEGSVQRLQSNRSQELIEGLKRLNDVTTEQYQAAWSEFSGEEPPDPADQLEALTNERHKAIFSDLKSYTISASWPGNRVASDFATIATNLEIVGDRACFIADVVKNRDLMTSGTAKESVLDIFEMGESINDYMSAILFEAELNYYDDLKQKEEIIHRELNELFELITAYEPEVYGRFVTVTRALERAIFYWVHTAELAIRLHSGMQPEHISMYGF